MASAPRSKVKRIWISAQQEEKGRYNQREREGETEAPLTNALIVNLQLSSGVEACASGKRIDAGNNMKRSEAQKKKVQSVQKVGVAVPKH